MSSKTQIADEMRRLGNMFNGMLVAADALDKIGSLENHIKELSNKRDELQDAVNLQKQQIKKDTQNAKGYIADAEKKVAVAEDVAKDIIAEAKLEGVQIIDKAREIAVKDLAGKIKKETTELADVKKKNSRARSESKNLAVKLKDLAGAVTGRQDDFRDITAKIAQIKESLGA